MELTVTVHQERESFWSEIKELPGCFASGGTLAELREALAEAVGLYLWEAPVDLAGQSVRVGEVKLQVLEPPARGPEGPVIPGAR
jgi:predicted RNase H-like HicB family nuclease